MDNSCLNNYSENSFFEACIIPQKELTYKKTTTFGSYLCEPMDGKTSSFFIKGTFIEPLTIGRTYSITGHVVLWNDKRQVDVDEIKKVFPKGEHATIEFLKSLPYMRYQAEILFNVYKEKTLETIRDNSELVAKMFPAINEFYITQWKNEISSISDNFHILKQLKELGLSSTNAKMLYDKYGTYTMTKIQEEPYLLSREIPGYGFRKCDAVARKVGISINDESRLTEGIVYFLGQAQNNGSTCVNKDEFLNLLSNELSFKLSANEMKRYAKAAENEIKIEYDGNPYTIKTEDLTSALDKYKQASSSTQKDLCRYILETVDREAVLEAINNLTISNRIVIENDLCFTREMYDKEQHIAELIRRIESIKTKFDADIETELKNYCSKQNIELETKQRDAALMVASHHGGCCIITGEAGCGKTFSIKIALKIAEENYDRANMYFNPIIMAPTGKASEVAAKATGLHAGTIHKILEMQGDGTFKYNASNLLPYTCYVIDETSLLDTNLFYMLLSAIPPTAKVILLGDTNQIASIGPGNILKDLIDSDVIPVVKLDVVKRQGKESGNLVNAGRVIRKQIPTSQKETRDSLVVKATTDEEYEKQIVQSYKKYAATYGVNEVQVLSPQRSGVTGTNYINYIIQHAVNKNINNKAKKVLKQSCEIVKNGESYEFDLNLYLGDRVINVKNDYSMPWYKENNGKLISTKKMGIFNGEMGTIVLINISINSDGEPTVKIVVKYEDKYIIYDSCEALELGYSMTIHKSQGSEWFAGVIAIHPAHSRMIDRNLLYTGITRYKNELTIVSNLDALTTAVSRSGLDKRLTGLKTALQKICV